MLFLWSISIFCATDLVYLRFQDKFKSDASRTLLKKGIGMPFGAENVYDIERFAPVCFDSVEVDPWVKYTSSRASE
jgi:hypothetical protein